MWCDTETVFWDVRDIEMLAEVEAVGEAVVDVRGIVYVMGLLLV